MEEKIIDGMKKESKLARDCMLFGFILVGLYILYYFTNKNENFSDKEILLMITFCLFVGVFGLYMWLYSIKYRVEFDSKKINLKTLFRKIEIDIHNVKNYTCNRYRKSEFYQFNLFVKGKKVLINTRYKDELEKILIDNNVEKVVK